MKRKVIAMTTEEKLQHFTTYAMEEARNKSDAMIREYTDAMRKIFEEHQEKKRRQEELEIKTETDRLVRENNKQFSEAVSYTHLAGAVRLFPDGYHVFRVYLCQHLSASGRQKAAVGL